MPPLSTPSAAAPRCQAQTYWYDNGVQRAQWCREAAVMQTRALDNSHTLLCREHGVIALDAGAELLDNPSATSPAPHSNSPLEDPMPQTSTTPEPNAAPESHEPLQALDFVRMYLGQTDMHPNQGHYVESRACRRQRPGGGAKDSDYRCARCDGEALLKATGNA